MFYKLIKNSIDYLKSSVKSANKALRVNKEDSIEGSLELDSTSNIYFMFRSSLEERHRDDIMRYALSVQSFDVGIMLDSRIYAFKTSPNYKSYGGTITYGMSHNDFSYALTVEGESDEREKLSKIEYAKNFLPITLGNDLLEGISQLVWNHFASLQPQRILEGKNLATIEKNFKSQFKVELEKNIEFNKKLNELISLQMKKLLDSEIPLNAANVGNAKKIKI